VRLNAEKLRVDLPGAVATVAAAPNGFRMWCTARPGRCEHLGAAFAFLGEVLCGGAGDGETERLAASVTARLAECLQPTDDGRVQLRLTLPEPSALEGFARSVAQLFGSR